MIRNKPGMATILVVILVTLGVVVVGVVIAGAVLLSDSAAITVNNRSCGTLDIAQGSAVLKANFLPGINVPAQIAQGDSAVIQVPKRFIESVAIQTGSVQVRAFSQSYTLGTSRLDMQRSTWDGAPLAGLVGRQVDIAGKHTLVLECK
jgi:hypothetical protein